MDLETFYNIIKDAVADIGITTMEDEIRTEIIRNVADDLGCFYDMDQNLVDDAFDAVCFYFDETIACSNQQ